MSSHARYRLKTHFQEIACYDTLFKDHFINVMQTPKLEKIVLNMGLGKKIVLSG